MTKGILRRILCGIFTVLIAVVFLVPAMPVQAASGVDRIDNYAIAVSVNDDGSLKMDYRITWTVLSNIEGPLTWVKIGVPNDDVDNVKALSSNIKKAAYYSEGGKDYIRIDFNRSYRAGDTFEFHYEFTQYNMFQSDGNHMVYDFTPGWFNEIDVTTYTIRWRTDKVLWVNPERGALDGYYVWTGSLSHGQRTNVKITYSRNAYNFKNHNVRHLPSKAFFGPFVYAVIIIASIVIKMKAIGDGYEGGGYRGGHHHYGGGCACACACAGGGRAGCSKKDFYGTKLSSSRVRAKLQEGAGKKC